MAALEATNNDLQEEMNNLKGEIDSLKEEVDDLKETNERLERKIGDLLATDRSTNSRVAVLEKGQEVVEADLQSKF